MVRKLRIGQLQGAALTQVGLGLLEPDILAVSVPFLVRDERELDHLLAATRTRYAEMFARRGFLPGRPAQGGLGALLRPGARGPARGPAPAQAGGPGDDPLFVEIWRRMGFMPSPSFITCSWSCRSALADARHAPLLARPASRGSARALYA